MVKRYKLRGLDCAHCAEKIERAVQKIDGVRSASVVFVTGRLVLDADENAHPEILRKAQKAISKIEKECVIEGLA